MDVYGLIGYPLEHSFSKGFFNEKFASENISAVYVNYEIPSIKDFKKIVSSTPDLKGLNVTIPYKEQVIPYLDELSENARQIGAVNVVKLVRTKKKTRLIGYNSDIIGFKESIQPLLLPHHHKALILGTGGSAKAIYYGLKQLGIESAFVSRTGTPPVFSYEALDSAVLKEYTVIVNCTPVGMFPKTDKCPDIPYHALTHDHLLYDLLYNPDETLFMKQGRAHGAIVKNGLEMLLLQAFASWRFWTS